MPRILLIDEVHVILSQETGKQGQRSFKGNNTLGNAKYMVTHYIC